MSKPLDINDLKLYRRHAANCARFTIPGEKKPPTYKPTNPKERRADTCACPIWSIGYLKNERHEVNGKIKRHAGR